MRFACCFNLKIATPAPKTKKKHTAYNGCIQQYILSPQGRVLLYHPTLHAPAPTLVSLGGCPVVAYLIPHAHRGLSTSILQDGAGGLQFLEQGTQRYAIACENDPHACFECTNESYLKCLSEGERGRGSHDANDEGLQDHNAVNMCVCFRWVESLMGDRVRRRARCFFHPSSRNSLPPVYMSAEILFLIIDSLSPA